MVGGLLFKGVAAPATLPLRARGSPEKGTKSEAATSAMPSRGPQVGEIATPVFSGVPRKGDKKRSGYRSPAFAK